MACQECLNVLFVEGVSLVRHPTHTGVYEHSGLDYWNYGLYSTFNFKPLCLSVQTSTRLPSSVV